MNIPGVQVDGNDVLAVRQATDEAVARGRAGDGPTLIEAMTYRWHGHNEGEEAFAGDYRPQAEQDLWRARQPIAAFRRLLPAAGAQEADLDAVDAEETAAVEAALAFAEASPFPDPEEALHALFAVRAHDDRGDIAR
jgi:pyruvate dehydrogenase E1 component alpha subunit